MPALSHSSRRRRSVLAAMDDTTRAVHAVLAQRQVDGVPGEVTGFQPLRGHADPSLPSFFGDS